jgi:general secretion pathway protein H
LPHGVQASLEIEGRPLRVAGAKGPVVAAPQVLILSSGELSPFRLRLAERRADGLRLELSSDGFRLPRVETLGAGG